MTVTEFFKNLEKGATWSAGVAFKRTNPLPLDRYSVFESKNKAETYASTSPVAYPGQVIAVISESEDSQVFYINEAMKLEPIGIIPVGEEGAIEVSPEGKITLHGFASAGGLTLPQKQPDGSLKWVAISEVVKGDGNTVTEGDQASIDSTGDEKKVIASLHGFEEATENQIPYKVGSALAWKDEYKYDDTQVKADIKKNTDAIGDSGSGLTKAVADNAKNITTNTQNIATNLASIESANSKIAELEANLGAEGTTGQKIAALEQKDAQIDEALKLRPTTKEVASQISNAAHLKRVVLESAAGLPAVESADADTIYMVPKAAKATLLAEASDVYVEYMAIKGKWEIIGDTSVDLTEYATKTEVSEADQALSQRIDNVEATANAAATNKALQSYIEKNDAAVGLKANQVDLDTANQNIGKKLDTTVAANTYATQTALTEGLRDKLDASEIGNYQTTKAAAAEANRINTALGNKANNTTVEALTERVAANEEAKTNHTSRIQALEKVGAEKNVINAVNSDEFTISEEDRKLTIAAIAQSKVTGLTEALAGKVNASDGYRLMSDEEGKKLKHIADNAQVNVLEGLTIDKKPLDIIDKQIELPKALSTQYGLVKLGAEFTNSEEGKLTLVSVNTNKLVQSEGDWLILQGGSALDPAPRK